MRYTLLLSLIWLCIGYGEPQYFLCGPDEDGCSPAYYKACLCIRYKKTTANEPYCLDFNQVTCIPLRQVPSCAHAALFKNQGACLATAFQSMPDPPCPVVSESFCKQHQIIRCKSNGEMTACID